MADWFVPGYDEKKFKKFKDRLRLKLERETGLDAYTLTPILDCDCIYNIIVGKRSNGKTYSALEYAIENYARTGEKFAYIRRWETDIRGDKGTKTLSSFVHNGFIKEITGGEWSSVLYKSRAWYFARVDSKTGRATHSETPIGYAYALTQMEHDKNNSDPTITTVIFDEFMSREGYLDDEFVLFTNVLSTIIRARSGVKIFMLGNTVSKFCPYFKEMGVDSVTRMGQGEIKTYEYDKTGLTIAVEMCKPNGVSVASDKYFAFDNPRLKMITNGEWELALYPRCPFKLRPRDTVARFYIEMNQYKIQGNIICKDGTMFIFFHEKSGDIDDENAIVFTDRYDPRPNYIHGLKVNPRIKFTEKVAELFRSDQLFYSTNEVGEIIKNFRTSVK